MKADNEYKLLHKRLHESTTPNEVIGALKYIIAAATLDKAATQQILIGMYLGACAAFERFVHELVPTNPNAKDAYLSWADKKYKPDDIHTKDFRAYWEIRNALIHGAGHCGCLRWPPDTPKASPANKCPLCGRDLKRKRLEMNAHVVSKLAEWHINKETDLYSDKYEKEFGLERLWSGLVGGFIAPVAEDFKNDQQ